MRAAALLATLALAACASAPPEDAPLALAGRFDFSDPAAFEVVDTGSGEELRLVGPSAYAPPHRSPTAIALLDGLELRSFVLEAELLQTGRDYGHRDLCLFFGFQAPDRYYYVHLATTPDANAHNVFLVDGAPRRNLLPPQASGIDWGRDAWHRVRLERDVDAGTLRVWFDDLEQPVLAAHDATLAWGRVGFGSFDDTGALRELRLLAAETRPLDPAGSPFAPR
ncbi:MAG: hypothetical protein H6828_01090 [Planctomycetes bacterium]|nr:hypothetical protein [Planctomycetota bacterium]